jgi:hypothetical protein
MNGNIFLAMNLVFVVACSLLIYYIRLKIVKNRKVRKDLSKAKILIEELEKKYPLSKITPELREKRELELIKSNINKEAIERAQLIKKAHEDFLKSDIFKLKEILKQRLKEKRKCSRSDLIKEGWDKQTIKRAIKIFKREVKEDGRQKHNKREDEGKEGIDTRADEGNTDSSGRNAEVEQQRVSQIQPDIIANKSEHTTRRNKQKPKWNWESFK